MSELLKLLLFFKNIYIYFCNIMMKITRKENGVNANTNAKKRSILRLLDAPARHIRSKIGGIYRKLVKKNR